MTLPPLTLAITGAAGQIAYSLLFRLASGELFGPSQPLIFHLLERPDALAALAGVKMELDDGAFPLLKKVAIFSDPYKAFEGIDYAFLLGARPRSPGMERKDLLEENGKIFIEQGKALQEGASAEAKIFVVGNPCNTNAWIALHQAPRLSKKNFFAMTRLDQNRAVALLAAKSELPVEAVSPVPIWGNHSSTLVPDFFHARLEDKSIESVIQDRAWLETTFISTVRQRGAEVLAARGKSSAASAAQALLDTVRDVVGSKGWFSVGVYSEGNPYGIDEDLMFSFPCTLEKGVVTPVPGLFLDPFLKKLIQESEKELIEERDVGRSFYHH